MLIAWSGHRPDVFRKPWLAEDVVRQMAAAKVAAGVEFICGGQRGVDQWAARAAHEHRLPFHLVLPNDVGIYTRDWLPTDRAALEQLIAVAASVEAIDERGELGPLAYDLRNEAIARRADALVVVWTGVRRGGTFHTICAARVRKVPVQEEVLEAAGEYTNWRRGL